MCNFNQGPCAWSNNCPNPVETTTSVQTGFIYLISTIMILLWGTCQSSCRTRFIGTKSKQMSRLTADQTDSSLGSGSITWRCWHRRRILCCRIRNRQWRCHCRRLRGCKPETLASLPVRIMSCWTVNITKRQRKWLLFGPILGWFSFAFFFPV